mgnify:CR=1 FL=1
MPVIRWTMAGLPSGHNDQENNELLTQEIDVLVDDLLESDVLYFRFEPHAIEGEDSGVYQFSIYDEKHYLLTNNTGFAIDPLSTGFPSFSNFKAYLIEKFGSNYKVVVNALEKEQRISITRYIFQELLRRVVAQNDNYKIVNSRRITTHEN